MSLQIAPMPVVEEQPAVATTGDEVARILADAKLSDGAALLDALEARRVELGLSNRTCELAAGLCDGHLTKLCGPSRERSPTLVTLDKVLNVLGLSIVLVRDPAKIEAVRVRWTPRARSKVRERQLSPTTIARARPHVLSDLARKAARPRWAGVDARTFIKAMVGENS
jgi:hypothetical protein